MPTQVRYKVALCTGGESLLLRRVLESMDDIDLYTYAGGTLTGTGGGSDSDIDVWIVEGNAASGRDPTASYMFIDTTQHEFLPVVAGTTARLDFTADPPVVPTVVGVDRGHSLLSFVSMGNIRLQAVRRCRLQPWGRTIVDGSEGPLIVEGDYEGQRTLYIAFNLYDSDFPLRAAFPIFMMNSWGRPAPVRPATASPRASA
jgi:hypothetical protein